MNPFVQDIFDWFAREMPAVETELHYSSPYELLVAVILSAQCTDKRVNMVTPGFFLRFPRAENLAAVDPEEVYPLIKSVSYPNNKARHLVGMAQALLAEFDGVVPEDTEALQRLPGVGRKTANVIASVVYKKAVIAVDTHVFRVSHRLDLSQGKTPAKVEADLNRIIPPERLAIAHHWLILHGRYVCTARKPRCGACGLKAWCSFTPAQ